MHFTDSLRGRKNCISVSFQKAESPSLRLHVLAAELASAAQGRVKGESACVQQRWLGLVWGMRQIPENLPTSDRNAQWKQLLLSTSSKPVVVLDFTGIPALYRLENMSDNKPMGSSQGFATFISSSGLFVIKAG